MKIIIETPKYSFFKYAEVGSGAFRKVMFSPIPTIFNYGFISGTKAQDGMEQDVVVIGPMMRQGTIIEMEDNKKFDGVVHFVDDSKVDDKMIVYVSGFKSKYVLSLYFRMYALYKRFLYLVLKRKISKCRFEGIE
ncbi:MAG: inorganic diphosphatase [DPANN group archaeon]|nr:inorganic diphosphatase [DPANN group archaeon]